MKNLIKIFAIIFAFTLFSCQKEITVDNEYVTVSFNTTLEGVSLQDEIPFTKASEENGLYGVQVNVCDSEYDGFSYSEKYCYGIFDDISILQIKFKRNEKYVIRIDYFPNGKNEIPYTTNGYSPLQVMPWHISVPATLNEIVYSNNYCLDYICCYWAVTCDRYSYWNENFIPTDNASIPINLLRMNAGITIDLSEVEGQEYSLINMSFNGHTFSANVSNGDTQIVIENIMLDMNQYVGIEKSIPDLFYYECIIGTPEQPTLFYKGQLEVRRNTMRTYAVRLEADMTTNGINVTYENGGFGTDSGGYLN